MSAEQEPALSQASMPAGAVFLSYASEDAAAAERIAGALRSAGIQVWFDREELRGGDTWDRQIRQQIYDCRLFIAIISAHTEARDEGYFRREWRLAVERAGDMAEGKAFLVPVVIDGTTERGAAVPDKFRELQWTRLLDGETSPAFVERLRRLLSPRAPSARVAMPVSPNSATLQPSGRSVTTHWRLKAGLSVTGAVLAVALAYFVVNRFWISRHVESSTASTTLPPGTPLPAVSEKSIAVLPFVDMSEKHDQEYFADGMAEETLNQLAKIPELKVIGRTSSFEFKGKAEDLRKIGATLGAAYILEGSVRRSGDRLRVTTQLIDARNGAHRWSESFDRSVSDVLEIQSEVALGLARALQIEITGLAPTRGAPHSLEAYDKFLRGLHAHEQFTRTGMQEAIADFKQALELDQRLVSAEEQLAVTQWDMSAWGFILPAPGYKEARAAAERALALDSHSATAHAVLCVLYARYDWDWTAAGRECDLATQLSPRSSYVLDTAANLQEALGNWDAASELSEASRVADPLNPRLLETSGEVYMRAGRKSDAEQAYRRLIAISPTYVFAHCLLAMALVDSGRAKEALAEANKETESMERALGLTVVNHALNRPQPRDEALAVLQTEARELWPMAVAEANAFVGHKNLAFEWLQRAHDEKDTTLYWIKGDPLLRSLEADARYKLFLRKMNLPE
jgi:TolB-like protein